MSKPKLKAKSGAENKSSEFAAGKSIMESAQQIWLAGLGAFAKAQKKGIKLFDELVQEGMVIDQKTRKMTTDTADNVREAVESTVNQVKERSQDAWDKLEKTFEERITRVLKKLGIPEQRKLEELEKRIEELQRQIQPLKPQTEQRTPKSSAASVAHVMRKPKDDLSDVAKHLEEAQLAAKKKVQRSAPKVKKSLKDQ